MEKDRPLGLQRMSDSVLEEIRDKIESFHKEEKAMSRETEDKILETLESIQDMLNPKKKTLRENLSDRWFDVVKGVIAVLVSVFLVWGVAKPLTDAQISISANAASIEGITGELKGIATREQLQEARIEMILNIVELKEDIMFLSGNINRLIERMEQR